MFLIMQTSCVIVLAMSLAVCGGNEGDGIVSPDEVDNTQVAVAVCPDVLEYVFRSQYADHRLLLTTEGAARIDFHWRDVNEDCVSTVMIPTDGKEVERLVGAVDALIGSDSFRPVFTWLDARVEATGPGPATTPQDASMSGDTVIRCRYKGRERVVRTYRYGEEDNYICEGVRKEIEMVGLLKLAEAANAHEEAESLLAQGDRDGAVTQYDRAMTAFMTWARSRCGGRYGGVIFEPELWIKPPSGVPYWRGGPERTLQKLLEFPDMLPESARESALEYLPRAWRRCTSGMVLSRSGEVIVIAFPEPVFPGDLPEEAWTWGLPVTTAPPELIDRLKAEDAWVGEVVW